MKLVELKKGITINPYRVIEVLERNKGECTVVYDNGIGVKKVVPDKRYNKMISLINDAQDGE